MATPNPNATQLGNDSSPFENEPCGRCGGSGRYSFNMMDGSRCYGCGGRGYRFTKRGAAAQKMFADSMKLPVERLRAGDKVRMPGTPGIAGGGWCVIETIALRDTQSTRDGVKVDAYNINFRKGSPVGGYHGVIKGELLRVAQTDEAKAAKLAAALEYQATLTKQGVPAKRRAARA